MFKRMFAAVLATGLMSAPFVVGHAAAQTSQPATTAKPNKPPSAGQLAARERAKRCGAEWKEAKAAGKIEKGQTWPTYWSACNKRLKAAAG